jgi:predicted helicase
MSGAGPETADLSGLWPHQREAVRAAAAHLARGERCQVIMACGTGKTRAGAATSRWVAPAGKVLVVVPTQELLAQTARVWAEHLGAGAGMIGAVCAEPGATADADEVRGQMAHLHAGVSTDPADVAGWLRAPGRATVFTTYASLPAVAAAHDMPRVPGWRWWMRRTGRRARSAGSGR